MESAQSVDRHRVAESYPLGGNGVAPATTNYPGAAAHTRLGGGTGFRRDEAVFSSRNAAPLNINVTDTYHVGIGDPVGRRKAVVFEYDRMRLEA